MRVLVAALVSMLVAVGAGAQDAPFSDLPWCKTPALSIGVQPGAVPWEWGRASNIWMTRRRMNATIRRNVGLHRCRRVQERVNPVTVTTKRIWNITRAPGWSGTAIDSGRPDTCRAAREAVVRRDAVR
ncbi:hypothetical protein [Pseudomonas sp. BAY1663]|uniref:hypothetical protein n=1 Tax=Pseudomonas sp. BAY1663 TaxID=1439940 RepID=UPI002109A9AB|nr:hypothetical protein [Pseudomonas sp. BAY1663]